MSYIDAYHDRRMDVIRVVERATNGTRQYKIYPVKPSFYYADSSGTHTSIYGDKLIKVNCKGTKDLRTKAEKLKEQGKKLFESDTNPVFNCLSKHYIGIDAPDPHVCFLDIETDFDPDRGHAPPENPFSKITAIPCTCNG